MFGGGSEEGSSSGTLSPLSVALGGTGADNAAGARTNLGITPANIGAVATSNIVDNVTTNDSTKVLSANQGKVLQDKIGSTDISSLGPTLTEAISAVNDNIQQTTADVIRTGDVVNNLTSTATNAPLSANMGKALNDKISTIKVLEVIHGTINAGTSSTIEIPITKCPYIIGYQVTGSYNSDCAPWSYYSTSTVFVSRVKNTGTNNASNILVSYYYFEM